MLAIECRAAPHWGLRWGIGFEEWAAEPIERANWFI
jgi:hypothetical protein